MNNTKIIHCYLYGILTGYENGAQVWYIGMDQHKFRKQRDEVRNLNSGKPIEWYVNDALEKAANLFTQYLPQVKGAYLMFITSHAQDDDFWEILKRCDIQDKVVYRSPPARNRNYPSRPDDMCNRLYIINNME